ncbi:hypothetical protein F383_14412 [Gossypium arboreum]|uniref:Uncharacterized protein n=1 Tax=Gossypium arboreum TaxID=29729 RepID=A0A0B0NJ18_GOSAR|nr:hypothetical protein F383_14412 [Gossypium arboreum]
MYRLWSRSKMASLISMYRLWSRF